MYQKLLYFSVLIAGLSFLPACQNQQAEATKKKGYDTIGEIVRVHPDLDKLIDPLAKIEVLAEGFQWAEGPLWLPEQEVLLFSDVLQNKIYQWSEGNGVSLYLEPSGYTGKTDRGGEMGSNGLLLNQDGQLVLCQHGNRQIALMNAGLNTPKADYIALAGEFSDKPLNSPNDIAQHANGDYYFTDPPYGLKDQSIYKQELDFQGVYRINRLDTSLNLLIDSISRPNGIALTPDNKVLLVGNSDNEKPYIYGYSILEGGELQEKGIQFDFSAHGGNRGPDGFKLDSLGNLYSSGPDGIWILNNNFELIGQLKFEGPVSNCYLANEGKTLFITAGSRILRVNMR